MVATYRAATAITASSTGAVGIQFSSMVNIICMVNGDGLVSYSTQGNETAFMKKNPGYKIVAKAPAKAEKPKPVAKMVNSRDPDQMPKVKAKAPKAPAAPRNKSQSDEAGGASSK